MTPSPAERRRLVLDHLALSLRKPSAGPLITPAEVIAISLSMVRWVPGKMHDPEDKVVRLILHGLEQAGWKLEPMERKDYES